VTHRDRPTSLLGGVEGGSERQGRLRLAEVRVKNWIADFSREHPRLGPSTQAFADLFGRVYGPALDQLRSEIGFKLRVGKAALRRIAAGRPTAWGRSGRPASTPDPRLAERYAAIALHPNFQRRRLNRPLPMHGRAWADTRDLAAELHLPMPRPTWWRTWFDRNYPEFARAYARGQRGFAADALPKIHRDNTLLDPLEWACLDGHVLNIRARTPDARRGWREVRPVLTGVLDLRTRLLTGWDIRGTENSDGILAGLKMTIRQYGCPRHYYADNGKAYQASVGARVRRKLFDDPRIGGLCAQTGAERHNAIPYHGWAKMIESWWRIIIDEFERYWPSFWGNVDSRPEAAGKVRIDQLPTIDEIIAGFREFLPAFHATERDCLGGLTPTLAMEQFRGEVRQLDPDVLDFLCCRLVGPRTVRADGVIGDNMVYGHFDEPVWRHQRRQVWLRIDPEQAETIWLCDESGAPLCKASNHQLTGATQEQVREAARIRARMRKVAAEHAAARDFLLDTNVQQIMRVRRRQAEARQEVARAALPASAESLTTIVRPDLVGPVKTAIAVSVALAGKGRRTGSHCAFDGPSTPVPAAIERLAALGAGSVGQAGLEPFHSFARLEQPSAECAEGGLSYERFQEAAG
jgi:hypothetical protein